MRIVALGAGLLLAGQAAAQDSWDLEISPAGDVTVASVTYEGGVGLAVQCRNGILDVAILGLPEALPDEVNEHGSRTLSTGFDAAALEDEAWKASPDSTVALSWIPQRRARALKRGGVFLVRTAPAGASTPRRLEIPLPADSAAIDRTLEACGQKTVDPRDELLLLEDIISVEEWRATRSFEMPPSSSGAPTRVEVSCIIAEAGHVRDCQVESESEPGLGVRMLRDQRNVRFRLRESAQAAVGRVIYIVVRGERIRR